MLGGLKPVQTIYAMYKEVTLSKIENEQNSWDVIKYHPHGDQAVYDVS